MSNVQEVFNELFDARTVTVQCSSLKDYHTIRTALCKKNQLFASFSVDAESICGRYDPVTSHATFTLAARKNQPKQWKIIKPESNHD